jgi:hypothetical protein
MTITRGCCTDRGLLLLVVQWLRFGHSQAVVALSLLLIVLIIRWLRFIFVHFTDFFVCQFSSFIKHWMHKIAAFESVCFELIALVDFVWIP